MPQAVERLPAGHSFIIPERCKLFSTGHKEFHPHLQCTRRCKNDISLDWNSNKANVLPVPCTAVFMSNDGLCAGTRAKDPETLSLAASRLILKSWQRILLYL